MATIYSDIAKTILQDKKRVRTANYRGSLLTDTAKIAYTTAPAAGDIIAITKVPYCASIKSITMGLKTADGSIKSDIGFYGINRDGSLTSIPGTVTSNKIFQSAGGLTNATTAPTALQKADTVYELIYNNSNDEGKELLKNYWRGKEGRNSNHCLLAFTITTAAAAANTIVVHTQYVEGSPSEMVIGKISPDDKNNVNII